MSLLRYLFALPPAVTNASWRTLSRLKLLLRKSFRDTEIRIHAPAAEGSRQARERSSPSPGRAFPRWRSFIDQSVPMQRDCKLHPTLWTPPDERFYLECRTSQISELLHEAVGLLGGEVPEQAWMVLRSGVVAWLDKYEADILGDSGELGRVTCRLGRAAILDDFPPAFGLVIREAPWDTMQPTLSIAGLSQMAVAVSRISLQLVVRPLPMWDLEDVLLATWGNNQFQELEEAHGVMFVTCAARRRRRLHPTRLPTRLAILAPGDADTAAVEAALRQRCCVSEYFSSWPTRKPKPSSLPLGVAVAWYSDFEQRRCDDLESFFRGAHAMFGPLFTSGHTVYMEFLSRWRIGLVTWRYMFHWDRLRLGIGNTCDLQNVHDSEDALWHLSAPCTDEMKLGTCDRNGWPPAGHYDILFICAKLVSEDCCPVYRFGVAGKGHALPGFHEELLDFVFNLQSGNVSQLERRLLQARVEKRALERQVQELEGRLRTSEAQLERQAEHGHPMSWLLPTFQEVAKFARSIPSLRPSGQVQHLPVLALRFTHKAVNAHFAFGEEHENRQESIFKLFMGLFMGNLKPEELEPLYVFKHEGPDGTVGLYSRNNRRLVALLMFQARDSEIWGLDFSMVVASVARLSRQLRTGDASMSLVHVIS
ncbi:unnamed protein product [Symbiodinium sp. CCMP2592]|nr:unnamed protein product [Symbiodinium sp. CCMP2592]